MVPPLLPRLGSTNFTDNLLERLLPHQIPLTRLGHPARILGDLHSATLDSQAARSEQAALAKDVKKEIEAAMAQLVPGKGNKGAKRLKGAERRKMWDEVRELRKE